MDGPVYITGTGLVTVQGLDVESNWANLLAGRVLHRTGIVPLPRDHALPRVSQLAIHAAREAHQAAGSPALDDGRTALIVGTSKGPIDDWLDQLNGLRPPEIGLGISQVSVNVAAALGHGSGPRLTMAGACASGLLGLIRAVDLIRQGSCDQALVVAAESSTHALFEANFKRLGVLATPDEGCRPFDEHRRGFLLAEAAAAMMVTRTPVTGGSIEIGRTAWLADAHHLTAPDPAANTLTRALSNFRSNPIGLVHAHGTGTLKNDPAELKAINQALGEHRPWIYSHKHAVGHTQGAAGLIAAVINVKCHVEGEVPANANSKHVMRTDKAQIIQSRRRGGDGTSIAISAGFGGTVACVELNTGVE